MYWINRDTDIHASNVIRTHGHSVREGGDRSYVSACCCSDHTTSQSCVSNPQRRILKMRQLHFILVFKYWEFRPLCPWHLTHELFYTPWNTGDLYLNYCVVQCVGSGHTSGWSIVQWILSNVRRMRTLKKWPRPIYGLQNHSKNNNNKIIIRKYRNPHRFAQM
jgi:hypothetical protein